MAVFRMGRVCVAAAFAFVLSVAPVFAQREAPAELDPIGKLIDANKDGRITDAEATAAAPKLMREANAKKRSETGDQLIVAWDANGDGKLDQAEVVTGIVGVRASTEQGKRIAEMFTQLDGDGDGGVTPEEFKGILEGIGGGGEEGDGRRGRGGRWAKMLEGRLPQTFAGLDVNRDGKIVVEEMQWVADKVPGSRRGMGRGGRPDGAPGEGNQPNRAEQRMAQQVEQQFKALDRDNDGMLSEKEAGANPVLKEKFRLIDADLDGSLSSEEVLAYAKANQEKDKK